MRYDERELEGFIETILRRKYAHILDRHFFGTIRTVTHTGNQYLCTLSRDGATVADGHTYLCVTPGYAPAVGDVVECMWRDERNAYVLWPTAGASGGGGGGAVSSVAGSGAGINVTPTTGAVVIQNTGVTSLSAGTGVSVSASTGAVTVSSTVTDAPSAPNNYSLLTDPNVPALIFASGDVIWTEV